jgi:hypothetical protein
MFQGMLDIGISMIALEQHWRAPFGLRFFPSGNEGRQFSRLRRSSARD